MSTSLTPTVLSIMAKELGDIRRNCSTNFETLNRVLPTMLEDENVTISLDRFVPGNLQAVLETFGEFSKEVHKLSKYLARFAVDNEESTITIIGSKNVIEIG